MIPTRDHLFRKEGCLTPDEAPVIPNGAHLIFDEDHMTEHCARTEPVNRKRSHQLLYQHQINRPLATSKRWQFGMVCILECLLLFVYRRTLWDLAGSVVI